MMGIGGGGINGHSCIKSLIEGDKISLEGWGVRGTEILTKSGGRGSGIPEGSGGRGAQMGKAG